MRRRVLPWLVVLSGLMGCEAPAPIDPCSSCSAGERCDLAAAACVPNLAPTVSFKAPAEGSFITAPQVLLLGSVDDDADDLVEPRWSVDDGRTWRELSIDAEGSFEVRLDVAELDGVPLVVTVRVKDGQGLEGVGTRRFVVDRVAPSVTVVEPAAGTPTNAAAVRFAGTVTDGSAVTMSLDFADGVGARPVTVAGDTFSVHVPTLETEDFVTHAASLRAVDAAGNVRGLPWPTTVDRVAPALSVPSPSEGQLFGASQVGAGGVVAVDVAASDGDPALVVEAQSAPDTWAALTASNWPVTTAPSDDGVEYAQPLRARDRAGNTTTVVRRFRVDRVAPTVVSTTPAGGARGSPREFSARFSEAVRRTGTGLPFAFSPAPPLAATSSLSSGDTVFTISGLAGGETYAVSVDPDGVADLAGNPAAPGVSLSFTTAPRRPAPGAVLLPASATRQVEWFRAAHDEDGVLSLAVRVVDPTTGFRSWLLGWVDPTTGEWAQHLSLPAEQTGATLFGIAERSTNGTQHRATAHLSEAQGPSVRWTHGVAGANVSAPDVIEFGVGPSVAEPAGTTYARVVQFHLDFIYQRGTTPTYERYSLGYLRGVDVQGTEELTVFGTNSSHLVQRARTCGCDAGLCSCTWHGRTQLATLAMDPSTGQPRVFGDLFHGVQVLRSEGRTFATTETWENEDAGVPSGKLLTGGSVTCFVDGETSARTLYAPLAGPARLARASTTREATVAVWSPPSTSSQPGHVVVHAASCPPTPEQIDAGVQFPLADFARAAGVALTASTPVFAPVLGPTPGLLYVATPGELKYLE